MLRALEVLHCVVVVATVVKKHPFHPSRPSHPFLVNLHFLK